MPEDIHDFIYEKFEAYHNKLLGDEDVVYDTMPIIATGLVIAEMIHLVYLDTH